MTEPTDAPTPDDAGTTQAGDPAAADVADTPSGDPSGDDNQPDEPGDQDGDQDDGGRDRHANPEAAKFRRECNEARRERDELRAQVEALQQSIVAEAAATPTCSRTEGISSQTSSTMPAKSTATKSKKPPPKPYGTTASADACNRCQPKVTTATLRATPPVMRGRRPSLRAHGRIRVLLR